MKEWGQFIIMLVAMAGLYGWGFTVLRGDIARVEEALGADIARVEADVETNLRAIIELAREVSELRGELKGRDLIAGS
ncbi:MAG: hypothetical protein OXE73_09520 [Gammaproteobacteria bacterium]|nr:hypothetical protein [Gammaproteobacteria bacterium]